MTTIVRQHPLKQQMHFLMIVSILFVLAALAALFAQHHGALHGASTNSPSQMRYSSIPATPGGASPGSQAGRTQNNPFRSFRNAGSRP